MTKLNFLYCTKCNTMHLKDSTRNQICPHCQNPGCGTWTVDPFEPQSWPFGNLKPRKSFHTKSTNEQFEIKSTNSAIDMPRLVSIMGCFFFFGLAAFVIIVAINILIDFKNAVDTVKIIWSLILCFFFVVFGYAAVLSLKRDYISIDNKYIYIYRTYSFFYKHEYTISRNNCIPKLTTDSNYNHYIVKLTYMIGGDLQETEFYDGTDKETALDKMRWLSMYVQYAYNEELLPAPTPILGHEDLALEPNTVSESQHEYTISLNNCIPELTTDPNNNHYIVKLTYMIGGDLQETEFYNGTDKETALDKMRWLSMYLKHAYNEGLLPDPTPILGHEDLSLEPNTVSESQVEQLK